MGTNVGSGKNGSGPFFVLHNIGEGDHCELKYVYRSERGARVTPKIPTGRSSMTDHECFELALTEYRERTADADDFSDLPSDVQQAILHRAVQLLEAW